MKHQTPASSVRLVVTLGVLLGLLLSVLTVGSMPAVAQGDPVDLTVCPTGYTLDGTLCIAVAEPIEVPCPDGSTRSAELLRCVTAPPEGTVIDCPADPGDGPCLLDTGPVSFDVPSPAIGDPNCPAGTRGVSGGCFIYVARAPLAACPGGGDAVDGVCELVSRPCVGVELLGDLCVVEGAPPVQEPATCPMAADIVQLGCYRLVQRSPRSRCVSPYEATNSTCRFDGLRIYDAADCPTIPGVTVSLSSFNFDGSEIQPPRCMYPRPFDGGYCPTGSTSVADECRVPVPLIPGDFFCEPGFSLIDSRCLGPAGDEPTPLFARPCPAGAIDDHVGNCRLVVAQSVEVGCGVDVVAVGVADDGTCFFDAQPIGQGCPSGFSIDDLAGGACAQTDAAAQEDPSCPTGSLGQVDACFIYIDRDPAECASNDIIVDGLCVDIDLTLDDGSCFGEFELVEGQCRRPRPTVGPLSCEVNGSIVGDLCLVFGGMAVRGPGTCPQDPDIVQLGCYRLIEPVDGSCPTGTTAVGAGETLECRQASPLVPGPFVCEAGFSAVNARCLAVAGILLLPWAASCPQGSFEESTGGPCRKPVANAAGAYFCSNGAAELVGRQCLTTIGAPDTGCEEGSPDDGRCVIGLDRASVVACDVADVPIAGHDQCLEVGLAGEIRCPAGFSVSPVSWCESRVPARCDVPDAELFDDVPVGGDSAYFSEPALWARCLGVTSGTTPTEFSPGDPVTRAQLATFLWRYAGRPTGGTNPFADVPDGVYFTDPVTWMAGSGITAGTTPTMFSPGATVTRAQMATFLWRFMGEPAPLAPATFADVAPGTYYYEPVGWLAQTGVTSGTSATTFSPNAPLTRGQAVTFLYRLAALAAGD